MVIVVILLGVIAIAGIVGTVHFAQRSSTFSQRAESISQQLLAFERESMRKQRTITSPDGKVITLQSSIGNIVIERPTGSRAATEMSVRLPKPSGPLVDALIEHDKAWSPTSR